MGGSSKKAPSAPDPVQTAGAQTGMNVGTAVAQQYLNNTNQVTPYGSLNYSQSGTTKWTDPVSGKSFDIPQFTATQTLSPAQQKLYNEQTRAGTNTSKLAADQTARLGNILGKPLDLADAPKVGNANLQMTTSRPFLQDKLAGAGKITKTYGDEAGYSQNRQKVEDALMARMNPSLEQERGRLSSQLANQGIKQGTEAYDRAFANYGQQANDARYGAILNAGEEQSRLAGLDQNRATFENSAQQQQFGQNVARTTFGNDARQQEFSNAMARTGFNNDVRQQQMGNQQGTRANWLNEQYQARNQPINEIAALLGTGQVTNPNFVNTSQSNIANTDYAGLVQQDYSNRMAKWQNGQQGSNSLMGGLFGLGSSAIMASDVRLKERMDPVGEVDGLTVYEFSYRGEDDRRIGFMAQDVREKYPEAVIEMPDGFLAVDYGRWV